MNQTAAAVKQGNNGQVLVAYLAADDGVEEYMIKEHLKTKIANYMIPQKFIFLERLPTTPTGKVDRKLLPAPTFTDEDIIAPRNEAEKTLASLWSEVLGIDEHKLSVEANFFELGGDSLKAIRLVSLIRSGYSDAASVTNILLSPTIASFCEAVPFHGNAEQFMEHSNSIGRSPSPRPRIPSKLNEHASKIRSNSLLARQRPRQGQTSRQGSNADSLDELQHIPSGGSTPVGSPLSPRSPSGYTRNRSNTQAPSGGPTSLNVPNLPSSPSKPSSKQNPPKLNLENVPPPQQPSSGQISPSNPLGHSANLTPPSLLPEKENSSLNINKRNSRRAGEEKKVEQNNMLLRIRNLNNSKRNVLSESVPIEEEEEIVDRPKALTRFRRLFFQFFAIFILVQPIAYGFIGTYMLLEYLASLGNFNLVWIVSLVYPIGGIVTSLGFIPFKWLLMWRYKRRSMDLWYRLHCFYLSIIY